MNDEELLRLFIDYENATDKNETDISEIINVLGRASKISGVTVANVAVEMYQQLNNVALIYTFTKLALMGVEAIKNTELYMLQHATSPSSEIH
jgi:hypothetical protein